MPVTAKSECSSSSWCRMDLGSLRVLRNETATTATQSTLRPATGSTTRIAKSCRIGRGSVRPGFRPAGPDTPI